MGKEIKTKYEILTALEHYYKKQDETTRECLFALKSIILSVDKNITHTRKFQIPFFRYNNFSLGFLWVRRKKIIVGFVEDKKTLPSPLTGREKDKVFTMEVNPLEDIPIDIIQTRYKELIKKYSNQPSTLYLCNL